MWLAGWPNDAGSFLVLFLLLLFRTGRLPSPRWRPVARLAVVGYLADVVGRAFAPGPIDEEWYGPLPNPLGIEAAADLAPVALAVVTALLLPALLAAVASLLVRLRRAQGVERLQLKWFCDAAALFGRRRVRGGDVPVPGWPHRRHADDPAYAARAAARDQPSWHGAVEDKQASSPQPACDPLACRGRHAA